MWKLLIFITLLITFTISYFEFTATYIPDSNGLLILKSQENITIKAYVNNSSIPAQVSKYSNSNGYYIHCEAFKKLNLKIIIETPLTSLNEMFSHQRAVSIKLKSTGENVKSLEGLFSQCLSLKSIDLTEFDLSQVTNSKYMFRYCEVLIEVNFGNSNMLNLENMEGMFYDCKLLIFEFIKF